MADNTNISDEFDDEASPFAAPTIPTDPAELEAWKESYTDALMDHYRGGVGAPWRKGA